MDWIASGSGWPHARGEMAECIRAFDWSASPLGPAEFWPAALRATVELMLASPQIVTLAVGPDRIFLYNDAASVQYGDRHPGALGRPLPQLFAHEFHTVADFYDRVFAGESLHIPAQPLDPAQSGRAEIFDAYLAPVRDEGGKVIAAHMTGFATGERLRAEARLRDSEKRLATELGGTELLRDLAERLVPEESSRTFYEEILSAAMTITQSDAGTVQLYQPESHSLALLVTSGFARNMTDHFYRVDANSHTACGIALRTSKRTFIDFDDATDEACRMHVEAGYRSAQATPLLSRGGVPLGMLNTHWNEARHRPSEQELRFLDLLARQASDLIEARQTREALRKSEELLRQFGDASQDVLWIRDAETLQWQYLTSAFETTYGISREEALSGNNYSNWVDLIIPEDRGHAMASIERVRTGEHVAFEFRIRRPRDGTTRWMRNTDFPIADAEGKIRMIGGIGSDITGLREVEQRLQTLMKGIPQLVWRAIDGGRWTWASPQWTDYTGQSESESHGEGWLDAVHPDDRESTRAIWAEAAVRGEFEAEYRVRHAAEQRYRWFQTRATPVHDASGAVIEWLGTSTDVDDLRMLQDRQQLLVAELQHRVRNILTVVQSVFSRTVEAGGALEDVADHYRGRLDSMARTQVATTHTASGLVDLENLIRDELLSVGEHDRSQVEIAGPDVALEPKAAETVGLAIHELTTNAIKYGALKASGATLEICWDIKTDYGGKRQLALTWQERGVPAVSLKPARYGFGSELIEEALPYALGAETTLQFRGGGVFCSISLPLPDVPTAPAVKKEE